jgi:hypothetical protein
LNTSPHTILSILSHVIAQDSLITLAYRYPFAKPSWLKSAPMLKLKRHWDVNLRKPTAKSTLVVEVTLLMLIPRRWSIA